MAKTLPSSRLYLTGVKPASACSERVELFAGAWKGRRGQTPTANCISLAFSTTLLARRTSKLTTPPS